MRKLYAFGQPRPVDKPRKDEAHAVQILLSDEDAAKYDALPRGKDIDSTEVTDQATGERFIARRASCGLRCFCAARLELVQP